MTISLKIAAGTAAFPSTPHLGSKSVKKKKKKNSYTYPLDLIEMLLCIELSHLLKYSPFRRQDL